MRRHIQRPYGATIGPSRILSLLMALAVLGILYERFSDPATWGWLAEEERQNQPKVAVNGDPAVAEIPGQKPDEGPAKAAPREPVIGAPNDQNPEAVEELQRLFEAVSDKTPLQTAEMPAYWKLAEWARSEPLADLEKRGLSDVAFTQIWERPQKYRGKLIRMRMHVRRVLVQDDLPENPLDLSQVYECWAWTDESKSFPYVLILTDAPPGLPIGTDVSAEIVFTGYFLKIMSYQAYDKARGAPLLIGRARMLRPVGIPPVGPAVSTGAMIVGIGVVVIVGLVVLTLRRKRRRVPRPEAEEIVLIPSAPAGEEARRAEGESNPFAFLESPRDQTAEGPAGLTEK